METRLDSATYLSKTREQNKQVDKWARPDLPNKCPAQLAEQFPNMAQWDSNVEIDYGRLIMVGSNGPNLLPTLPQCSQYG